MSADMLVGPDESMTDSMVGAEGFEPPTLCSQSRCATRLRYAPTPVNCNAQEYGFFVPASPAAIFPAREVAAR